MSQFAKRCLLRSPSTQKTSSLKNLTPVSTVLRVVLPFPAKNSRFCKNKLASHTGTWNIIRTPWNKKIQLQQGVEEKQSCPLGERKQTGIKGENAFSKLRIVIAPIFHLVMLLLKFLGTATCQHLMHFTNSVSTLTLV